ncbi:hypothetical protein COX93_01040 [Candidatus Nomurabacteria bacterium CG_4_10_14_0_2_um_filter_30_12]|uniref:Zinc-binding domain-containing protein n=2 Tax=Candidatus Nomuraibacteriota TaxID=1752729 RepID=A0A2J0ML34_9BACT|nr:MAG: hypothetical protein COU48_01350 [Candidatus Nomurabacteria bacterium CG10_big_fil_rev_8_21_14_0_10_03_31_7]PIZ87419.1 MAG: hypothetical protein COX93_01040 [Candidatus Nomurabacteria bacterium CG_4_10_14_0_2_um_filter_30_12]
MQKTCKTCGENFEIRDADLVFYEQVKVPTPNYCPDCRMRQRLSFRNERTLYKRICDLCKKDGVCLYPTDTPFPVYCHKCWWSDKWNPMIFGKNIDSAKSFLEQFGKLKNEIPRIGLLVINSTGSDYTNNAEDNKNCYLLFAAGNNEDCMYGRLVQRCKNSLDCDFLYDSELCYECIDTVKSFKCMYGERLQECVDVLFSFDMRNCQNCILCTNGRNLTYCIENKRYTKEEYEQKKAEILSSHKNIQKTKEKYIEIRSKVIVKFASTVKCNKVAGDYLYNCHDGIYIFDDFDTKNCSYVADADNIIDCFDCNNIYTGAERCYNVMGNLSSRNNIATIYPMYCNDVHYSDSCYNCESCFGCVGLNKKKYCILNKEYTKEEYQKIKEEIIENMKKEGVYGDFIPPELSPFGYNETLAYEYYPMTKKESKEKGFNWQSQTSGTYGKKTIKEADMPETIQEVKEDPLDGQAGILKEILVCSDCKKNFRITKAELDFYKRMHLPLPHKDFECRHKERMSKRNPRKLWHRKCMKESCDNEFETAYSPNRPEKVYCEECYNKEIY